MSHNQHRRQSISNFSRNLAMVFQWRHTRNFFVVALFFFAANSSYAQEDNSKAYAIAKQNACLGCHNVNKKVVGPSFQSIAQRYKNDSGAQTFLKNKIAKGGSGSWGVVPMPANSKLSEADLSILARWILLGAPGGN